MDNFNDKKNPEKMSPDSQNDGWVAPEQAQPTNQSTYEPNREAAQPQQAPAQAKQPQKPNEVVNQLKSIFLGWFSANPLTAFRVKTCWATDALILGATLVVQMFLGGVYLMGSLGFLGDLGSYLQGSGIKGQLFGRGIGVGVVISLVFLLLAVGMSFALAKIFNPEASAKRVVGLTAIALVPMVAFHLVAFFFGFFLWGFSSMLYQVSIIVFFLALYLGYQVHVGRPKKSPLWVYIGLTAIVVIIVKLVLNQMAGGLSGLNMGSLFNGLSNLDWGL